MREREREVVQFKGFGRSPPLERRDAIAQTVEKEGLEYGKKHLARNSMKP